MACDSGGKGVISAIYCISFIFGVNFVMLNLVIAVIIDQFVESAGREGLFLDNTLFEILHKKMLLDRFLKRLRTKVGFLAQPCLHNAIEMRCKTVSEYGYDSRETMQCVSMTVVSD